MNVEFLWVKKKWEQAHKSQETNNFRTRKMQTNKKYVEWWSDSEEFREGQAKHTATILKYATLANEIK